MKKSVNTFFVTTILIFVFAFSEQAQGQDLQFYQLKTYFLKDSHQEKVVDQYLKEAYLPALKRSGIENVGAFKPIPNKEGSDHKIYVLIPFDSLEQFLTLDAMIAQDKSYISAGANYINASHDNAPYERISSTLMKAFSEMPTMKATEITGPKKERVYELRSYESATEALFQNKVDMFNAGGEVELFESLGFNAVFYAEVLSGDRMPNLMYMTTFKDMESRDAHWDAFRTAEKWLKLKAEPKYQNNVSKADIMLLYPTDYSDY
ncbi:NIPSNAP family containing protein [Zobellia sp. OII3]|uniref:NIPSNAP family protein n=1 Tax=Zobellia sp. OII3 TaxID=2034520 RepID=UPI000B530D7F|nr:NIPSNAP family protein [Zobellia sp. OII3]OWW25096.1 NIPSNAP family containing protein [Zobellia sp. OII3]